MKRILFLLLILLIFYQLGLPQERADFFRSKALSFFSPLWSAAAAIKTKFSSVGSRATPSHLFCKELEELEWENHRLRLQVALLETSLEQREFLYEGAWEGKRLSQEEKDYFKRREKEWLQLAHLYEAGVVGKVIFREASSWANSFWVNVGKRDNEILGRCVVAKDSPVVIGGSVVGKIDYVDTHRSRVRIITDLETSVRAVRGGEQKRVTSLQLKQLLCSLEGQEEVAAVIKPLVLQLEKELSVSQPNLYLAKGSLGCMGSKLFCLQGEGFNYAFADEESSVVLEEKEVSLVERGDILITTGMDGVFPPGLRVGQVIDVSPQGDSSYELKAMPLVENLADLSYVTILPLYVHS